MKIIFYYCLLFVFVTQLHAYTPTENYLLHVSEEQIAQTIQLDEENSFPFQKYADFFRHVREQENEHCIGYHATTTAHFIFQEFIRIALEERYGSEIPEDFYFLRAPGSPEFDNDGCSDIIKRFGRPKFSPDELRQVVIAFIDAPINSLGGASLDWRQVNDEKIERLYSLLLSFAMFMPNRDIPQKDAGGELKVILEALIPENLRPKEQTKMIQAIKKFIKEPFADDFQDLYPSSLPYKAISFPFDDSDEELQNLLIALNISLYGNHGIASESTVHIFAKNESIEIDEQEEFFLHKTQEFLKQHDLNSDGAAEVLAWAQEHFPKNGGVLLQFFADPVECPCDLNSFIYVSGFYGEPFFEMPIMTTVHSDLGEWVEIPGDGQKILISKQLRLVLSNKIALDPSSGLKIKQYDYIDPMLKEELRERIRLAIR